MSPAAPSDETGVDEATRASSAEATATSDDDSARTSRDAFDDGDADDALPGGVTDALPLAGRKALVTLLTHRFVSRARQQEAWAGLLAHEPEIRARLEELFLVLVVDHDHEVAFKRQGGEDDVPVLLRREKPLSRDASLLMVFARREHAFTDGQDEAVVISKDAVAEFLGRYHDDSGSDEVRARRRVDAAIAALVARDLLTAEPDDPELFVVSPAIVPLMTADRLAHLERVYLEAAGVEGDPTDGDEVGIPVDADAAGAEVDADIDADADADADVDVVEPEVEVEPDPADAGPADTVEDTPDAEPDPTAVPLDLDLDLEPAPAHDAGTDTDPEAPQA
ncbi:MULTISPECIES: DUF4194 domain-containing protein [unclassified Frigoribacterium]|uniref:DUF4194 domain-containing protein n=1 Tax=unclassified Frigoribacterium TaxID=2627005 RepID=UPI001565BAAC|nr:MULTISPECIES: DUF4194 domain-containing protein [unclassified Frigoribacterium]NQW85706.1 DUF4194 domain-containing protein [Frigoribacterium sp. VKM Ac-2860]NQX07038.1 DUF4194 domain-containing protein [Frigoribacterium sp. VKM Ac-2859]